MEYQHLDAGCGNCPELGPPAQKTSIGCQHGKHSVLLSGEAFNRTLIIPLEGRRPPASGLFLGNNLLPAGAIAHDALSIGCGGLIPAELCGIAHYGIKKITAIDIDQKEIESAEKIAKLNGLQKRINFIQTDIFKEVFPVTRKFDLLFSDISQMPLQPGFKPNHHDHGGKDGWAGIQKIIDVAPNFLKQRGYLTLFAFSFLGILDRTCDERPSLLERLAQKKFEPVMITKYRRKVRHGGVTHRTLQYIRTTYPLAKFHDEKGNELENPLESIESMPIFFDTYAVGAQLLK